MKKYVITLGILITLAGCSASTSIADSRNYTETISSIKEELIVVAREIKVTKEPSARKELRSRYAYLIQELNKSRKAEKQMLIDDRKNKQQELVKKMKAKKEKQRATSIRQKLIEDSKNKAAKAKAKRVTIRMQELIDYLKTRVGKTSYVFSGASPYGWDCSGMVRWTYGQFGLEIPHSANKQGHLGERVSEPKLGDIVVFAYQNSTDFYHSAIYIGNGEIVHANQARGTTVIEPLSNYKNSQIRFVRVIPTA